MICPACGRPHCFGNLSCPQLLVEMEWKGHWPSKVNFSEELLEVANLKGRFKAQGTRYIFGGTIQHPTFRSESTELSMVTGSVSSMSETRAFLDQYHSRKLVLDKNPVSQVANDSMSYEPTAGMQVFLHPAVLDKNPVSRVANDSMSYERTTDLPAFYHPAGPKCIKTEDQEASFAAELRRLGVEDGKHPSTAGPKRLRTEDREYSSTAGPKHLRIEDGECSSTTGPERLKTEDREYSSTAESEHVNTGKEVFIKQEK